MVLGDEGSATTLDVRRRVFVVATGAVSQALVSGLRSAGFEVASSDDATGLVERIYSFRPDLVLLGEQIPQRAGRQVALSLRATGATFALPLVAVLPELPALSILSWLRVGAVDLWRFPFTRDVGQRARELIDECDRSRISEGTLKARLLAWVSRAKLDGTVISFPNTPFEGRATFVEGELDSAQFGSLEGERALEHFLELEDGTVIWEDAATAPPQLGRAQAAGFRGRALVVEDDPALRHLVSRQLQAAHFLVQAAGDGQQGLAIASQQPWDVLILDLDLPKLDGWGVLRELRNDVALREAAVLVLSAHESMVDTLKAARAGARAYLKKSGRSKELHDAVSLLITPRATTWEALRAGRDVRVETRSVGPLWLLRTLSELDCAGRLDLEDELGRYEVSLAQGQLLGCVAQTGSLRVTGLQALEAVLKGRGSGRFVFAPLKPPEDAPWLFDALDEATQAIRELERSRWKDAASSPHRLLLNEELAALFARIASVGELKVLEAVRHSSDSLEELSAAVELPLAEVEVAVAEMLRRGVLVTP